MATARKLSYKDRNGKKRDSSRWYACLVTPKGEARIPGYVDKRATLELGAKLEKLIALRAEGTPPDRQLARWVDTLPASMQNRLAKLDIIERTKAQRTKSLADLLDDFRQGLIDGGATIKHADETRRKVKRVIDDIGAKSPLDIRAGRVTDCLAKLREDTTDPTSREVKRGISVTSSNNHLTAIKGFVAWLIRERRLHENPLATLRRLNGDADRRHERRPLELDELRCLLANTDKAPTRWRMTGPERSALYRLAATTGLRSNEIRSLTRRSFENLSGAEPSVTVEAGYSKRRRRDTLPVPQATAAVMRGQLATKTPDAPAFNMPSASNIVRMLRDDLTAAREAWIKAGDTDQEREARKQSSFLAYRDDADRIADFHSLRGVFISTLIASGADAKTAQELARHSTPTLTFNTYAVTLRGSERAAVEELPNLDALPATAAVAQRTGTEGESGDSVLPISLPIRGSKGGSSGQRGSVTRARKSGAANAQNPLQTKALTRSELNQGELGRAGFEPATHGFSIRCSTN